MTRSRRDGYSIPHLSRTTDCTTLHLVEPTFDQIAERIRQLLDDQELTQRELARRANLAPTQINVILSRLQHQPYAIELETLARIANGAGVSLLWLLSGLGDADAETPPSLRQSRGWKAAFEAIAPFFPGTPPALWRWIGELRLPLEPRFPLSPWLIERLHLLGTELFSTRLPRSQGPGTPVLERPPVALRSPAKKPARKSAKAPMKKSPRT